MKTGSYKTLQSGVAIMQGEDRNDVKFGFTPQSENWNGRFAMIGFLAVLLVEFFSDQGVLHFWGLM